MGRNNQIKLNLKKDEMEQIQKKADKLGLKPSQYVRMVSLNASVDVEEKKKGNIKILDEGEDYE